MATILSQQFNRPLLSWYDQHGRKDLPWQHPRSAYRVWVSEIMLQQTQVQTVIAYFQKFMLRFPELTDLANASNDDVMALWSGLGYYSRARNLHKTACLISEEYQGIFPSDPAILVKLPGIGPSTAAAIASQAFNLPTAILDGNVKRVLSRYFTVEGPPQRPEVLKRLWSLAQACMPIERCADYTQAIMDLGATCCKLKNPECQRCPLQQTCQAYQQNRVKEFPFKKIKKTIPHKHQQFLLLYRNDDLVSPDVDRLYIYLEKNPPNGLWGELWCMPGIDVSANPNDFILEHYGFKSLNMMDLMEFKHSFSHFHLHIKVKMIETRLKKSGMLKDSRGKWFKVMETANLALAKPTKDIINQFIKSVKSSII